MIDTRQEAFSGWLQFWLDLKKETKRNSDYKFYLWFLKEAQKTFSKLYLKLCDEPIMGELISDVLSKIMEEMKWAKAQLRESELPF